VPFVNKIYLVSEIRREVSDSHPTSRTIDNNCPIQ